MPRTKRDVAITRQRINANRIIARLQERLKRGNYENFGSAELGRYRTAVSLEKHLTYQDQCELISSLSERIHEIQVQA